MRQERREQAQAVPQGLGVRGRTQGNANGFGCGADSEGIAQDHRKPELTGMSPELASSPRSGEPKPEVVSTRVRPDIETLQGFARDRLSEAVLLPDGCDDRVEFALHDPLRSECCRERRSHHVDGPQLGGEADGLVCARNRNVGDAKARLTHLDSVAICQVMSPARDAMGAGASDGSAP